MHDPTSALTMYTSDQILPPAAIGSDTPPSFLGSSSDISRSVTPAETEDPDELSLHSIYYFEDNMVTFLVGGRLFKIHRHFLARDSEKFRAMMNLSQDPIELVEVTVKEFECLLNFFYRGMYYDFKASLSDWVAVLSIATRFGFQRARERATIEIDSTRFRGELGPVQKIVWAKEYDIQSWLPACYEALCQRETGLEDSEAEMLGIATTNRIWKAREAVRENRSGHPKPSSTPTPIDDWDNRTYGVHMVANVVREVFPPPPVPRAPSPVPSVASSPVLPTPPWLVASQPVAYDPITDGPLAIKPVAPEVLEDRLPPTLSGLKKTKKLRK